MPNHPGQEGAACRLLHYNQLQSLSCGQGICAAQHGPEGQAVRAVKRSAKQAGWQGTPSMVTVEHAETGNHVCVGIPLYITIVIPCLCYAFGTSLLSLF